MKIFKISANIDLESLRKQITPTTPIPEVEKIAQQAYQKNALAIIGEIVKYPQFVNNLSIGNLVLKTIENGSLCPIEILRTFLSNLNHIDFAQIKAMDNETRKNLDKINNQIVAVCLQDGATISAAILENTPPDLTNRIVSRTGVWQKDKNLANDPVLQQILIDLEQYGQTWKNQTSAFMLMSRLMDNELDKFITEASKYDMLPPVAKIFQNAAGHHRNNRELNKNITENKNPGIVIENILNKDASGESDPEAIIISFIDMLSPKEPSQIAEQNYYTNWIWNYLLTKMQQNLEWAITAFSYEMRGDNIVRIFYYDHLLSSKPIFSQLIDIILKYKNQYNFSRTYIFNEVIENGLIDPNLRSKILQLPEEYFQGELNEESKSILRSHYHPQLSEDAEEFMGLMNSKYEWMIKYANNKYLLKEAGYQNEIAAAIAVAMIILGIEIGDIIDSTHLSKNQILELKQNKALQEQVSHNIEFLNDVKEYMKTQEKPLIMDEQPEVQIPIKKTTPTRDVQNIPQNIQESNLDKIVDLFIKHEGLLPKQTPFRITSPEMGKKDSIHGFAIDRTTPKPAGRQNFIFLKNPNDVHGAVKQQLIHYINNPSRYGFNGNPTLLDIIKKFDQTGAKNKVNFIIAEMPGLDINKPLSEMA